MRGAVRALLGRNNHCMARTAVTSEKRPRGKRRWAGHALTRAGFRMGADIPELIPASSGQCARCGGGTCTDVARVLKLPLPRQRHFLCFAFLGVALLGSIFLDSDFLGADFFAGAFFAVPFPSASRAF